MMVAQQLYEGIPLGKQGTVGLITYMRTDSTRIADTAKGEAAEFIETTYGSAFQLMVARKSRMHKGRKMPTRLYVLQASCVHQKKMEKYLDKDQLKLYRLIWSRFVASQMTPAILDTMKVTLQQNGVIFIANGSKIKFKGFMQVYVEGRDDGKEDKENILPEFKRRGRCSVDLYRTKTTLHTTTCSF